MAKQRSGSPIDDSDNPQQKASDGWPAWMGAADPSLAPKPPPAPPKAAPKPGAAGPAPRKAAPVQSRAPAPMPVAADPAPAPAPLRSRPRLALRIGISAVVLLWAFVGGVLAARYQPDVAVRFQQAAADAQVRLGSLLPSAAWMAILAGLPLLLFGLLVWQSGRPRRPIFVAFAFFVALGTASIGMIRGGHDVDMERSAADFRSRLYSLRQELDVWKQAAARQASEKDRTMAQALSGLESKLQAAESDRAKSSMALQQNDEMVTALRKEIDELRKKLAEKD